MRILTDGTGWKLLLGHRRGVAELRNADAVLALATILPRVTWQWSSRHAVARAVGLVMEQGGPDALLRDLARSGKARYTLLSVPDVALAVDIASQADAESTYLDEQLRVLERHWREAEQVAAIADDLLTDAARARLERLRAPE